MVKIGTFDVHEGRIKMGATAFKHKHLKLDQKKIDFAKRYFGVESEQEAIDRALALLIEEQQVLAAMKPLKGSLKSDRQPWPYR
jgi:DNA topoisomerase IB